MSWSRRKIRDQKKSFQNITTVYSAKVASSGFERGMMMRQSTVKWPAPSILADSRSDDGILAKKVRKIITLNAEIAGGSTSAHMESTRPSRSTTR